MKAIKKPVERADNFEPFVLELTVETREEAQALYAIFNLGKNSRLLGREKSGRITDEVSKEYYVSDSYKVISNSITYENYYHDQ